MQQKAKFVRRSSSHQEKLPKMHITDTPIVPRVSAFDEENSTRLAELETGVRGVADVNFGWDPAAMVLHSRGVSAGITAFALPN